MAPPLKTVLSSAGLLSVIFVQSVWGTFFPEPQNAPPIPGQSVRAPDNSPQQIFIQEDVRREILQPQGLFSSDIKPEEERWYIQENQAGDSTNFESADETYDRYYPNGEPAIGPVATPMPDDNYVAEPSSISKVNPNEPNNPVNSDIWVLTSSDNQYAPERWVRVEVPSGRLVEVVNQETGQVLATDSIKSVAAPVPQEVPVKSQLITDTPGRIVQQVWIRAPEIIGSQKVYSDPTTLVEVPPANQIVEVQPKSIKQIVQQPITKEAIPVPPPLPKAPIVTKSSFTVPPPPPPSLKGTSFTSKVIPNVPVNVVPDTNIIAANKNGLPPQIRHIWIPTSPRTGKFISVPVSPAQPVVNKGIPLGAAPVAVSDTWVLKQDGPVPSFEQQKSVVSGVQKGKVLVQNPPDFQIDTIPAPPVIAEIDSPKNVLQVGKNVDPNVPINIWPIRKDINAKNVGKSPVVISELAPPPPPPLTFPSPKTDAVVLGKSAAPVVPQKTLINNPKGVPLPAPLPAPAAVQVINGKPCPIPAPLPQKSLFPPALPVPRVITTQRKQPLTRIIRVNRYPSGGYYLLNSRVRPNIFTYPSPAFIRQSSPRIVRLIQTKPIPVPAQSKSLLPPQTKQISIPVQSKQIPAPIPARQVVFPFSSRQLILPAPNKQSRIIYPGIQAVRYAYPWNAYLNSNPVPGKGIIVPQLSPIVKNASLKRKKSKSKSDSSSSESSSSESSSEESKEEKKEEKKKEKEEKKEEKEEKNSKEEKSESGESSGSEEKEREIETESESKSKESEENDESVAETESKESIEIAESQLSETRENQPVVANTDEAVRKANTPYIFRYDHRDRNGTVQHRHEMSDAEGRVSGAYGYYDSEGKYRLAKYFADDKGFRVKVESNEPGTVTHESAHANFISNQATAIEEKPQLEGESTDGSVTTDFQRD